LYFHELESNNSELIFEDDKVEVITIPLKHRIYANGYLFKEKPAERTLDIEAAKGLKIDKAYFNKLKQGFDVENEDGQLVSNEKVTFDPSKPKSYAFCSDTVYKPDIVPIVKDVTAIYHESTFLDKHEHLCEPTKHSTASQAALIAKDANAGTLILGHYSTRYDNLNLFKKEAQRVFENVELAEDGKVFNF
jgi:ribonuclease Z